MPIRTNRGRAAVYRRLWSWPLRSPNHLIATIVGFAVVIIVFTSVIPAITKGARGGGANNAATSTSQVPGQVGVLPTGVPTISLPTKAAPPSSAPASAPVDSEAAVTADLWADAWITRPADNQNATWLETLKKYTTDELLPQLKTVDPGNLPSALEGVMTNKESHPESAVFEIGLKGGGVLRMSLVKRDDTWLVHKYERG